MFTRIRKYLAKVPGLKVGEHLAIAFASAFALAAVATGEHAAATHGFSLRWSFFAGVGSTALTAAYQTIRPQLVAVGTRILKRLAIGAKTKA